VKASLRCYGDNGRSEAKGRSNEGQPVRGRVGGLEGLDRLSIDYQYIDFLICFHEKVLLDGVCDLAWSSFGPEIEIILRQELETVKVSGAGRAAILWAKF
jgi:hypothetical protein